MNITRLHLIFFSPVFHTRVITRMLGARLNAELGLAETPVEHDITDYSQASPSLRFGPEDLVILASPVYGGRLPYPAAQRLMLCEGRKTPALLVVSYGNRAFEDALLEMKDIVEKQKFLPVAAAACVAEHSIAPVYAAGRPDADDEKTFSAFSSSVKTLLDGFDPRLPHTLSVPGNHPYRLYRESPLPQTIDERCTKCGMCAQACPTHAISETEPDRINSSRCISCMRCVNICPCHARHASEAMIRAVTEKLAPLCSDRKENSYFLAVSSSQQTAEA